MLGADITYNDDANDAVYASNYTAIGCDFGNQVCFFSGHFDGRGHTVSGIRIYKGAYRASIDQGLFGLSGGNIRGITLADARITGYYYTGGIVGENKGTVSDCHVAADVYIHAAQSGADNHGGIVGENGGTIDQCTSAATLTIADADNSYCYGGIAGYNYGNLSHNLAIGATVPAAADNTYGAICGENGGTLENNYYHDCTVAGVENATGKGCNNDDVDDNNGAMPAFLVTPGEGITIQTPMADDLGFSYDSDGDGQDENYWRKGAQLILANQFANVPEGYASSTITVTKTADGTNITGNVLSGTTLTVPTADVTVTVTLTPIPWSGTGTKDDPWVISYASQLDLLAQRVNSATGD